MLPLSRDVLDVVIRDLQRFVAPHVQSADAQQSVMMLNFVLSGLMVEERETEILSRLRATDFTPLIETLRARRPLSGTQRGLLTGATRDIENLVAQLHRYSTGTAFETEVEPTQRQLTPQLFTGYLRDKLPGHPHVRAASLVEIGGGAAKKTYRLDVENGPSGWDRLILRQDVIGGPTPLSVLDEVDLLRLAERHGLPVAHIHWVEPDRNALDAPFTLNARLPGACNLAAWHETRSGSAAPWEQLAQHMAALHRIPLAELSPAAAARPARELFLEFLDSVESRWNRDAPFADPFVRLGFAWLRANVPGDAPQAAIVHADLSERNILMHEGRITALLDWELWHVGDPAYELAYVKPWISQLTRWDSFIERYRESGAPPVNLANLPYWYIFSEFRNVAMLASGLRTFVDGRNRDLKLIMAVMYSYRHRLMLGLRELLPLL